MTDRPKPPKPCPVCKVAMQEKRTPIGVANVCQRCGLTITIEPEPKKKL